MNATELFYISADPISVSVPLLSGTMLTQAPPPFMTSSLSGPAVFHATGLHASMGLNNIMIGNGWRIQTLQLDGGIREQRWRLQHTSGRLHSHLQHCGEWPRQLFSIHGGGIRLLHGWTK